MLGCCWLVHGEGRDIDILLTSTPLLARVGKRWTGRYGVAGSPAWICRRNGNPSIPLSPHCGISSSFLLFAMFLPPPPPVHIPVSSSLCCFLRASFIDCCFSTARTYLVCFHSPSLSDILASFIYIYYSYVFHIYLFSFHFYCLAFVLIFRCDLASVLGAAVFSYPVRWQFICCTLISLRLQQLLLFLAPLCLTVWNHLICAMHLSRIIDQDGHWLYWCTPCL